MQSQQQQSVEPMCKLKSPLASSRREREPSEVGILFEECILTLVYPGGDDDDEDVGVINEDVCADQLVSYESFDSSLPSLINSQNDVLLTYTFYNGPRVYILLVIC